MFEWEASEADGRGLRGGRERESEKQQNYTNPTSVLGNENYRSGSECKMRLKKGRTLVGAHVNTFTDAALSASGTSAHSHYSPESDDLKAPFASSVAVQVLLLPLAKLLLAIDAHKKQEILIRLIYIFYILAAEFHISVP